MTFLLLVLCLLIVVETLSQTRRIPRNPFPPMLSIISAVVLLFTGALEGGTNSADSFLHAVQVWVLLTAVVGLSVFQLNMIRQETN